MSRHLDNLKRLLRKLQAHYGDDDVMVLQVKHALESVEALESGYQNLTIPYRERLPSRPTVRYLDAGSQNTTLPQPQ